MNRCNTSVDMIDIHLDSMAGLRKELKRLPISKVSRSCTNRSTIVEGGLCVTLLRKDVLHHISLPSEVDSATLPYEGLN